MSRLEGAFAVARAEHRALFVAYVTGGDPTPARTVEVAEALVRAGAGVLEIGIPFSDPIADGPTNQRAAERALATGTSVDDVLAAVAAVRAASDVPIVLFTYSNPVLRRGVERFAADAAGAGADGVLFTDVPVEELDRFAPALHQHGLDPILLVTPTSTDERLAIAAARGAGFLYLVSRTGVTGARRALDSELASHVARVRAASQLPVAVGFGISTPAQVAEVALLADGVVVGSAIVDRLAALGDDDRLAAEVEAFTRPLVAACRR